MQVLKEAALLRIFVGEQAKFGHRPLYEAVVMKALDLHLAGATVLRGPLGYGQSSRVHSAKILDLSEDLPMVVEIVDSREKIDAFLPVLADMVGDALVTLETVKVLERKAATAGPNDHPTGA